MEKLTDSSALVKLEPSSQRAIILADSLKADTEQRVLLGQYIHGHMKEGTDFGVIPGTQKPSLLKPGAEKLVDLFRCTPKFHLVKTEEDFDKGFFNYMFRVRLVSRDSGQVLAEGYGSANSREGRYRWREGRLKCPGCKKETLSKSKDGPGFYCWAKKGGCALQFKGNEPTITGQVVGKVENEDIATMANTILKMAKKRAMVDGAIALARCSDMFTQDVEDFADQPAPTEPDPKPVAPLCQQMAATSSKRAAEPTKAARSAKAPTPAAPPSPLAPAAATGAPTPFDALRQLGAKHGLTPQRLSSFVSGIIPGKKAPESFTAEDVLLVEDAFRRTSTARPVTSDGEPPPGIPLPGGKARKMPPIEVEQAPAVDGPPEPPPLTDEDYR